MEPKASSPSKLSDSVAASLLESVLLPFEPGSEQPGDEVGSYVLKEKLGEGGFGVVWRAEQRFPVHRHVAVKMIKLGMDSREVLARFEQERHVLARMTHPNIATMIDAGMSPDGRPYFVMELVKGLPLTRYCAERQMSLRDRILLFKDVCMGVQHAHQKGVIHRDLKPTNILVVDVDGSPVAKIIDFGIAKATSTRQTSRIAFATQAHMAIGTPIYMSPEQLIDTADVDTRSDIYSLGALLYELLTGQPPFDAETLSTGGQDEMRRIIREEVPLKPSKLSSRVRKAKIKELKTKSKQQSPPAQEPGTEVQEVTPQDKELAAPTKTSSRNAAIFSVGSSLSKDLDLITLRALEKDPRRRYPSAAEFADDLQRFLNHEPVHARPPTPAYLVGRWIRRNRKAFAAAVVSALALLTGTGIAPVACPRG